jgi:hypothetical protein
MMVYVINYDVDGRPLTDKNGMIIWYETMDDVTEAMTGLARSGHGDHQITVKQIEVDNNWYAHVVGNVGPEDMHMKILNYIHDTVNDMIPNIEYAITHGKGVVEQMKKSGRSSG